MPCKKILVTRESYGFLTPGREISLCMADTVCQQLWSNVSRSGHGWIRISFKADLLETTTSHILVHMYLLYRTIFPERNCSSLQLLFVTGPAWFIKVKQVLFSWYLFEKCQVAVYSFSTHSVVMRGWKSLQLDFSISVSMHAYLVSLCFLTVLSKILLCITFTYLSCVFIPHLSHSSVLASFENEQQIAFKMALAFITIYSYDLKRLSVHFGSNYSIHLLLGKVHEV